MYNQLTKNELEIQGIKPVKLMRLGKKEPNQNRPLLVALPTIMDKREFMTSLYKLKNASEGFNSLSITHDLTKEERHNLVREAKRKQKEETSNTREFRIRFRPGNFKNRMDSSKGQLDQKPTEPQEVPLLSMLTNADSLSNKMSASYLISTCHSEKTSTPVQPRPTTSWGSSGEHTLTLISNHSNCYLNH